VNDFPVGILTPGNRSTPLIVYKNQNRFLACLQDHAKLTDLKNRVLEKLVTLFITGTPT
jgi:hypothetical protein